MKVERSDVKMTRITLEKGGGVTVSMESVHVVGGKPETERDTRSMDKPAHDDFIVAMQDLKFVLLETWAIPGDAEEWGMDNLQISSISLNPDNTAIVVTGKVTTEMKSKVAMNSPRIDLKKGMWGIEDQIQESLDQILKEAYAYLYKGKRGQAAAPELFDDSQEDFEKNPPVD